jgi:hypothetical protein
MSKVGDDLHRVGAGLRLVLLGLAAATVAGLARVLLALAEPGKDLLEQIAVMEQDHPATVTVLTALTVLSVVLGIAGKALCLAVPAAAEATAMILLALAGSTIGLALHVAGALSGQGDVARDLQITSGLSTLLGYLFFLRFLSRLAAYLGSRPLAARAGTVQLGTMALVLVLLLLGASLEAGAGDGLKIVGLFLMVGVVVIFVKYIRVVLDLWRETEAAAEVAVDDE